MVYIKKNETLKEENLGVNLYQAFLRKPLINTNRSVIMELIENRKVDVLDVELLKFVYSVSTCSMVQLEKFAQMKGIKNLDARLPILLDNLLLNCFILVDDPKYKGAFPPDAETYFCIHSGGKQMLEKLSDIKLIDWESADQYFSFKKVIKLCAVAEITLRVMNMKVKTEVTPFPRFRVSVQNTSGKSLSALSTYRIVLGDDEEENVIVDTFFDSDNKFVCTENISLYSQLLATNTWKKYYGKVKNVPILFIITLTKESALDYAKTLNALSKGKSKRYMFITLDSISKASDTPPYFKCLKLDPDSMELVEFEHYLFS